MLTIYHNTRCRKSREGLALLKDSGNDYRVREYLKEPLSAEELTQVLHKLKLAPIDIIRKGESLYKENYKGKEFTDAQWIQVLADNPTLIERPIVETEDQAVIGRPPSNILTLL